MRDCTYIYATYIDAKCSTQMWGPRTLNFFLKYVRILGHLPDVYMRGSWEESKSGFIWKSDFFKEFPCYLNNPNRELYFRSRLSIGGAIKIYS